MEDSLTKGLFGFNKKEVENYISDLKADYESELKRQNTELQSIKEENRKLNDRINELLNKQREVEKAKQSISEVLLKAEQQAKQIVEEAKGKAEAERQEIDQMIELEREKLLDAKMELSKFNDQVRGLMQKFSDDIIGI